MTDFDPLCVKKAVAWVNNASEDLSIAYENFNRESYPWSIFIAATAAEKSLKAVIFLFEKSPTKMHHHDIWNYYNRALVFAPELVSVADAAGVFEVYDSYVRYPEEKNLLAPSTRYGKVEAAEALEAAGQILPAARDIINKASEIIRQSIV